MRGYTINYNRQCKLTDEYKNTLVVYKSNHSYLINKKITEVLNSNCWKNRRCFILAGGLSLVGFDYSMLDSELTIGINKTFQFYQNATINYSMDSTFYDELHLGKLDEVSGEHLIDKWNSFKGVKVFLTPMEFKAFGQDVYLVKRLWKPEIKTNNLDEGIWGGVNSALGAISLAAALGANPIYLLGYDFFVPGTQTHCHGGYPGRNVNDFRSKLEEYKVELENFAPLIKNVGIQVVNLNSNSRLRCFPFDTIERILSCPLTKM